MATLIPITIKLDTTEADKNLKTFEANVRSVFTAEKFSLPIGFDANSLKADIADVKKLFKQLAGEVQETFKSVGKVDFSQAIQQAGELKKALSAADSPQLKESQNAIKTIGDEAAATAPKVEKLKEGLNSTGEKVEATASRFEKLKSAGESIENVGGKIKGVGELLSSKLTEPITGLAEEVVTSGIAYENSMNSFQDSTKATAEEIAQASAVAFQLSTDMSLPATSAAQAMEAMDGLGKAGFTAAQSMAAAKDIIKLAAAGQIDQAKAAEIAAGAIHSFNLKAEDSARVADLFAGASKASGAEISALGVTFTQASANFAAAKVPIDDFTTAVTVMANAGVTGADAGKSLNAFLSSIQTPSKEGAVAIKNLGIDIFEAGGKMKSLPDIIGQFDKSLTGLTDQEKVQAIQKIFGKDASQAAQALFKDGVAGFEKIKAAVTEAGTASEMAAAKTKGVSGAFELLKARAETIGTVIYAAVKDKAEAALIKLADLVGHVADYLGNLSKNNPQLMQIGIAFLGIVAAIGPVSVVLGSVVAFLGPIIGGLGTVAEALAGAGGATALLTSGFTAVSSFVASSLIPALATIAPIVVAVVAVIGALAAVAIGVYEAWQTNFGNIQNLVAAFQVEISDDFNGLMQIIQPAIDAVSNYATEGFGKIEEWWATNGENISKAAEQIFGALLEIVRFHLDSIKQFWAEHGETITKIVSGAWDIVKALVSGGISAIGSTIKLIADVINGNWSGAWQDFKDIAQTTVEVSKTILKKLVDAVLSIVGDVTDAIGKLADKFLQEAKKLAENIISGLVVGIGDGTGAATGALWDLGLKMIHTLKSAVDSHSPSREAMKVGEFVSQGFALGIAAKASDAAEAAEKMANGALKSLADVYKNSQTLSAFPGAEQQKTIPDVHKQTAQDATEKAKNAKDAQQQAEQTFKKISDSINKILTAGVKGGFKNMLKAALGEVKSFSDSLLANFTKSLSDALAHAILGSGGKPDSFDIGSMIKGIFGGSSGKTSSPTTTPVPGTNSSGANGSLPSDIAAISTATRPRIAGGNSSNSVWDNLKTLFSTKDGGIFAPRTNILKKSGSNQKSAVAGYIAGAGTIASFVGGLIGDNRLGRTLTYAGQGAQMGAMFGPWGAAIGAGVGALIGLFSGGTRKQDEKSRTAAINDAMSQLQALKAQLDARPPTVEPATATSNAAQIQAAYYTAMNQLKDSKTRNIAIQDGHLRVDPLVSQVSAAAAAAQAYNYNRQQTASNFVGEFAGGVAMDAAFRNQYQNFKRVNGMMPGAYTGRDYIRALIGDGEVVANPMQLARMRRAAGFDVVAHAGLPNYTPQVSASAPVPKFAGGVSFASTSNSTAGGEPQFNFSPTIEINLNGQSLSESEIESIAINGVTKYYGSKGRRSPKN